ncbi:hypothetical protein [Erythrobacter sp. JK5]|uniref:hypothetical protein n=1 Tax=Erythrobacter sp. JK5 TaxID=2829500 RepID=UPI001BADABAE|nr:hypothetical protein [Erythrobacter sp. JK5]QUL38354.1 hypothetical protein KDC96_02765 [Erythrobacter sp. JK5]
MFEIFAIVCFSVAFAIVSLLATIFLGLTIGAWAPELAVRGDGLADILRPWRIIAVGGAIYGIFVAGSLPAGSSELAAIFALWTWLGFA